MTPMTRYGWAALILTMGCAVSSTDEADPVTTGRPWLAQGWSEAERTMFHYTSQGSQTFPLAYEWFVALEQPSASPEAESPAFIDFDYLAQFGFIRGRTDAILNPLGMPIGFAQARPSTNPMPSPLDTGPNGEPYTGIGLTCAACHTGQLEYRGTRLLIDGGAAMIDLGGFRAQLGAAIGGLTNPVRQGRFVEQVLGPSATPQQIGILREQISGFLMAAGIESAAEESAQATRVAAGDQLVTEGFTRLDALARIGNQIFWTQQRRAEGVADSRLDGNYALPNAPVNFPPIWDAPWFDWVQYNGSLTQPMFRNFSEALGVGAKVNLTQESLPSTPDIESMYRLEAAIAGPDPYERGAYGGLLSPKWPEDVLGAIDSDLAMQGRDLYATHCQTCHLPPPNTPEFWSDTYWEEEGERRYLVLPRIDIATMGTDSAQAHNFITREIILPDALAEGPGVVSYGAAIKLVEDVIVQAYDRAGYSPAQRDALNGFRENRILGEMVYRARPLNGMWATPPFLHNSSVPTLYDLLSPVSERPVSFYLGSLEFDPERIGFEHTEGPFLLDTSQQGNRNTGHEFADGPRSGGIIGPFLTPDQRLALIEYIKTL